MIAATMTSGHPVPAPNTPAAASKTAKLPSILPALTRQFRSLAAVGLFLALFIRFGRGTPGTRRQDNGRRCGRRVRQATETGVAFDLRPPDAPTKMTGRRSSPQLSFL